MLAVRSTRANKNMRDTKSLFDGAFAAKAFFLKIIRFIVTSFRKVHRFVSDGRRK
jgi:hypothetical protein